MSVVYIVLPLALLFALLALFVFIRSVRGGQLDDLDTPAVRVLHDEPPTAARGPRTCLVCERGPDEIPLLRLEYRSSDFHICPQHLPVLIHDPTRLVGKLPGAEKLEPADHQD